MSESKKPLLRQSLEKHLSDLPVLPTVVASLLVLNRKTESYFDDVLALIESDPSFSARILGAANSAASGANQPVATLQGAIARLGSVGASNLVVAMSVARVFVPRDDWEKSLWRHAIQVAIASRGLASKVRDVEVSPNEAYTCGLLHDIGRFVMFQEAPEQLRGVDEGDWETAEQLVATEKEICGLTHAELGAIACEKWGLPDVVTQVVRDHHTDISERPSSPSGRLTTIVRVADFAMFPSARPGGSGLEQASDEELREGVLARLPKWVQFELPDLRKFLLNTAEEASSVLASVGLS